MAPCSSHIIPTGLQVFWFWHFLLKRIRNYSPTGWNSSWILWNFIRDDKIVEVIDSLLQYSSAIQPLVSTILSAFRQKHVSIFMLRLNFFQRKLIQWILWVDRRKKRRKLPQTFQATSRTWKTLARSFFDKLEVYHNSPLQLKFVRNFFTANINNFFPDRSTIDQSLLIVIS